MRAAAACVVGGLVCALAVVGPPPVSAQGGVDLGIAVAPVGHWTVGVEATLTVVVTNHGSSPTSGVTLVQPFAKLPDSLTSPSASGPGWTCGGPPMFGCTSSDVVAPGAAFPPITFKVTPADAAAPVVTFAFDVTASFGSEPQAAGQPNVVHPCVGVAPAADPAVARADLAIDMAHVGDLRMGVPGSFTATVTNNGPLPTSAGTCVMLSAPRDAGSLTSPRASGTGWTCTSPTRDDSLCLSDAVIPAGGSFPPIVVPVVPTVGTPATAVATAQVVNVYDFASGNDVDSDPVVVLPSPDIALTAATSGTFTAGVPATITVTVTNRGPIASAGTVVIEPVAMFPTWFSQISGTGTGWTCVPFGTMPIRCSTTAEIAVGGAAPPLTYTFTPTGDSQTGTVQLHAGIDGQPDSDSSNNGAVVSYSIAGAPTSTTTSAPTTVLTSEVVATASPTLPSTRSSTGVSWVALLTLGTGALLVASTRRRRFSSR